MKISKYSAVSGEGGWGWNKKGESKPNFVTWYIKFSNESRLPGTDILYTLTAPAGPLPQNFSIKSFQ